MEGCNNLHLDCHSLRTNGCFTHVDTAMLAAQPARGVSLHDRRDNNRRCTIRKEHKKYTDRYNIVNNNMSREGVLNMNIWLQKTQIIIIYVTYFTGEMATIVVDYGGRVEALRLRSQSQGKLRNVLLTHNGNATAIMENKYWKGMLLVPWANRIAYVSAQTLLVTVGSQIKYRVDYCMSDTPLPDLNCHAWWYLSAVCLRNCLLTSYVVVIPCPYSLHAG